MMLLLGTLVGAFGAYQGNFAGPLALFGVAVAVHFVSDWGTRGATWTR